jgi:adenosylhomocysteine nucleosidase
MSAAPILVCFAVKEEAAPFRKLLPSNARVQVLVTGMGAMNSKRTLEKALAQNTPSLVLTCGLAGGLAPELKLGNVVFDAERNSDLWRTLASVGATPARIHCAGSVATTTSQKSVLRAQTGADAVEMESGCIREMCALKKIPAATVRVILDAADEELPLDFNQVMTPSQNLDPLKLAGFLARNPGKIPALMKLQKQTHLAAKKLAEVLHSVLIALGV